MASVGVVLSAGGIVGQAYHAGVLAALEHDLGWDPRTADVIVGSSAGSITGTLLRLGVRADDLAAFAVEVPLSLEGAPLLEPFAEHRDLDLPPLAGTDFLRPWRLPSPALLAHLARRPWAFRPSVAAMTLLPAGRVDILERAGALDGLADDWPEGLWICTARRDSGRRVVFGHPDAPAHPPLSAAVAASCAIPGYFAPIVIDGVEYLDGGVHSPTNADVLAPLGLDVVVVVSSMSAAHGRAATADALPRWFAHRRLQREVAKLRKAGTEVVRIEPGPRSLRAMGLNAMADDRASRVVRQAFLEAGRYAIGDAVARRLGTLATRPSRQVRD